MDDDRLLKARREAQSMPKARLVKLIGEGPEGLAPELWSVLLEERRRRDAAQAGAADGVGYVEFEDVPWFRRSTVNSRLLLLGLFFPPAMMCVCGTLLTGDVYYDETLADGTLKRWPRWNRTAALVLLGLQVVAVVYRYGIAR